MAQYCDNFTFYDDAEDSFQFWNGLRGPAGPAGAPGPPGSSVELKGPVASTAQLPETASSSELWLVGSAAPYHGYFYNGSSWKDAGEIAVGPEGPPGADGTDGADGTTFTPTVSSAGVISWSNDGGKQNPASVNIKGPQGETGQTGPSGADGTTFTPTVSSAGVISWSNDGGKQNPASVNIKGPQGSTGPAGPGVPAGGSTGQVLKKSSSTDYATEWGAASAALYFTSVSCSATTGDFATVSNAAITADMVVVSCVFANPSAITSDVTWTTAAGSLTLNGTCSAATTADIVLVSKSN